MIEEFEDFVTDEFGVTLGFFGGDFFEILDWGGLSDWLWFLLISDFGMRGLMKPGAGTVFGLVKLTWKGFLFENEGHGKCEFQYLWVLQWWL